MTNIVNENNCFICNRIEQIKNNTNPYLVTELETCYVVLGDNQFYNGYTILLSKTHTPELHLLPKDIRTKLLIEMAIVGEAVFAAFQPKKLNYELLGNEVSHVHWHIFPRYLDDPNPTMPIWVVDKSIRNANNTKPNSKRLENLKKALLTEINKRIILK